MRTAIAMFAALAAGLGGCGAVADWAPEEFTVRESLEPGDEEEGKVVGHENYEGIDDWVADIGPLPPGFDYDTESLFVFDSGTLWIEYEIRVEEWVPPGLYEFEVEYRLYDFGSIFREEIEIEFLVRVREPDPDEELLVLRVAQAFGPGRRATVVAITR